MIVLLDADPATSAQLAAALADYARRLGRNGGHLSPDLLRLLRSLADRSGQERPKVARQAPAPHSAAGPTDEAGVGAEAIGLTYRQTSELLGVSERTVRRRVTDGDLPVVRIGAARRVPAAAVEALVAKASAP